MRDSLGLGVLVLVVAAVPAAAQTKFTMSGTCGKPDVQHALIAADAPDHMMIVAQGKCAPIKGAEIGGSVSKEATFTDHGESTGNTAHASGMYVDTLANGEKVYYRYEGTSVLANGALQTWSNKWQIVGGTAKLKGIKGQGTCTGKGTPEGSLAFECQGQYTLGK